MAAALAMQIAHEMDPSNQHHKDDIERLMRRIPQAVADVLEVQHACSLVCIRPKHVIVNAHAHRCIHACTHILIAACQYNVQQLGSTAHGDCHHSCELCCTSISVSSTVTIL